MRASRNSASSVIVSEGQGGPHNLGRCRSYLSSHDPRVVLGIGKRTKLDWIEVQWPQPSGLVERSTNLPVDRDITIKEGSGKWS